MALPTGHNLTNDIITVRPLSDRSREIAYRVYRYFTQECKQFSKTRYNRYFQQVYKRFTDATGVSQRNLTYVLDKASGEGPTNCTSMELGNAKKDNPTKLYDLDYGIIRDIIIDSHLTHTEVDMIWLIKQMQDKISFNASNYMLKFFLRRLGFRFLKTENNQEFLLESHKKRLIRIQYLDEIKKRRAEGRHIVFMNDVRVQIISEETKDEAGPSEESVITKITKSKDEQLVIVHAWNIQEFSPCGFLIFKFDDIKQNYERWLCTQVLPNLPENSVLVMTSSLYPDGNEKTSPHAYSTKEEMLEWLNINEDFIDKNVVMECRNFSKPQIYDIICKTKKAVKAENSAKKILAENGFCLMQLPPYHWGFNPIHYIWPKLTVYLAEQANKNDSIENMLMAEVNTIAPDEWMDALKKSITYEKTTMVNEYAMDKFIDNLKLKKDSIQDSDVDVSDMSDED